MTDVVSPAVRSRMMSGIKRKDTKPEMLVRKALFAAGYRFRIHRKDLPGSPDIVMPGRRVAIFVHGCFWHFHQGCRYAKIPGTRTDFWKTKLEANVTRDQRAVDQLHAMGWRVLSIWECSTRSTQAFADLQDRMLRWLEGDESLGEIGAASKS